MRRRDFIAGVAGAAAWPVVVRAQRVDRMQRIGVLMAGDESDPQKKSWLSAFTQGLAELGWTNGINLRIDVRWAENNVERMTMLARDLAELQPDVILASNTPATAALQRETQRIPILFVGISDPVGSGFVAGLPRPGGNLTGFINMEAGMGGKWLQLLTEIAPSVKRAAIMFNPDTAPGGGSYFYLPAFEAAARSLTVVPIIARVHSDAEIETVMTSLGREPRGGLIVPPDSYTNAHRAVVILLAARNNVPAVYRDSEDVKAGGLISYGPDVEDIFRRAAPYVDRILRGTKPADLPVQLPIKFEMAINVKTAKALGLAVPQSILLLANTIIE
jgi:putative ABC transport system substrate-binding protein